MSSKGNLLGKQIYSMSRLCGTKPIAVYELQGELNKAVDELSPGVSWGRLGASAMYNSLEEPLERQLCEALDRALSGSRSG